MDIKLFSKCLKDAICDLERVAVPHLGVFQAELMPASYSDKQTTINPPYRKMSFRRCEVTAEQAANFIKVVAAALNEGVSQAEKELEDCLARFCATLKENRLCLLPGLGKMKADSKNDYFFVPDAGLDIYPEVSGLGPICIKKQEPLFNIVPDVPTKSQLKREAAARKKEEAARLKEEAAKARAEAKAKARKAVQEAVPSEPRTHRVKGWLVALVAVLVLIVLIVAFAYLFPDIFSNVLDHILYSKEELQLLGR